MDDIDSRVAARLRAQTGRPRRDRPPVWWRAVAQPNVWITGMIGLASIAAGLSIPWWAGLILFAFGLLVLGTAGAVMRAHWLAIAGLDRHNDLKLSAAAREAENGRMLAVVEFARPDGKAQPTVLVVPRHLSPARLGDAVRAHLMRSDAPATGWTLAVGTPEHDHGQPGRPGLVVRVPAATRWDDRPDAENPTVAAAEIVVTFTVRPMRFAATGHSTTESTTGSPTEPALD